MDTSQIEEQLAKIQEDINSVLRIQSSTSLFNRFEEKGIIPLLTNVFHQDLINKHNYIPDENLVEWKIDKRDAQSRNPMNGLIVSGTGTGKTRIVKNIVKSYHKAGYNILYVEPKSFEMFNANQKGSGVYLHPEDYNSSLPVVSYSPAFARYKVKKFNPDILKKTNFYSHNLLDMSESEIWESFGVAKKAADGIVGLIKNFKGKKLKISYMINNINRMKLMGNTKTASIGALENLQSTNFFNDRFNEIPIEEEWKKGNIVVLNYHNHKGINICADLGIILDRVMEIGQRESRTGLKNVSKKLLVFDDSLFYTGPHALQGTGNKLNLAAINIGHCQNNARTWGVDTLLLTQNASANFIDPILVDSPTYVLCSQVPEPEPLRSKLPTEAYNILIGKHFLGKSMRPNVSPDKARAFNYPWILAKNRYQFEYGYPFDCSVGHI